MQSLSNSVQKQTFFEEKQHFLRQFVEHQQTVTEEIEKILTTLTLSSFGHNYKVLFQRLQSSNRKIQSSLMAAKDQFSGATIDADWAFVLQEMGPPTDSLFGSSRHLSKTNARVALNDILNSLYAWAAEGTRCLHLAKEIVLLARKGKAGRKTAVSPLSLFQKPTTYGRPVCIQISGTGVRQPVQFHSEGLEAAINQLCWALAGKAPHNHIWVDSELTETTVKFYLWNDAITLKPTSLEKYQQLINAPHLFQFEPFHTVMMPLAVAEKRITKSGGQLLISPSSPTRIELTIPYK